MRILLKQDVIQNALHSISHALEHLREAESGEEYLAEFDPEPKMVEWRTEDGHLCFSGGDYYTTPPHHYGIKFAVLHLVQGMELLIKHHILLRHRERAFCGKNQRRTVSLRQGLQVLRDIEPFAVTPDQYALIWRANDLRDQVEHYEFHILFDEAVQLACDFVAVCNYLALRLHNCSIKDELCWNHLRQEFDERLATTLEGALGRCSTTGVDSNELAAALWEQEKPEDRFYLCLNCGARGVEAETFTCSVCGAPGESELGELLDELAALTERVSERGREDS